MPVLNLALVLEVPFLFELYLALWWEFGVLCCVRCWITLHSFEVASMPENRGFW